MFVITGATGTVGRPLVEQLIAEGAVVRAITRDRATATLPAAAEVVEADPARPETVAPHLEGATGLFLHSRAAAAAPAELVALARERGVRRVVALAASNVDEPLADQPSWYRGDRNKETEDAAVDSGLEWTSLRAGAFADNALLAWGQQLRAGDVVRYPYPDFAESPIDVLDLASVAARALRTDDLIGRRPVLTGPQSITHAEMIAVLAAATGRPLRFEEVSPEHAAAAMVRHGMSEQFVTALMARYERNAGRPAEVTDEVEQVLGRPAHTFSRWAARHAGQFG